MGKGLVPHPLSVSDGDGARASVPWLRVNASLRRLVTLQRDGLRASLPPSPRRASVPILPQNDRPPIDRHTGPARCPHRVAEGLNRPPPSTPSCHLVHLEGLGAEDID